VSLFVEVLNRMPELVERNFRVLGRRFLVRTRDSVPTGDFAPSRNALPAEPAIAIVDEFARHDRSASWITQQGGKSPCGT
jgi:hypothetical protein